MALMVAGGLLFKHGRDVEAMWAESLGLVTVAGAAMILLWAARRYESLHRALRVGSDITYPAMIATVAVLTSVLSAAAVILVVIRSVH